MLDKFTQVKGKVGDSLKQYDSSLIYKGVLNIKSVLLKLFGLSCQT